MGGSALKVSSDSSNTCDNSYKGFSVEERVLKLIDESEVELNPCYIAHQIHAKRSTVRVLLRKLLDRGLVLQPYPGAYCNKITYGLRFVPLCVHNVAMQSVVVEDVEHWEGDEVVGGVKLHVCFGKERRKVSGFIACDAGMSEDACLFALHRWFDLVEGRLGRALVDLKLTTFEVNKDYHGVRVDGVSCVTKEGLFGMVERVYQKEKSLVRREWKVSKPTSLNAFEAAIQRGVGEHDRVQGTFELAQKLERVVEAQKFTNSRLLGIERLTEAMAKRIILDAEAKGQSVKGLGEDYSR